MAHESVPPEPVDIELTATVRADEMCFGEEPRTHVGFDGHPGHESRSGSDRVNLPDRVAKGVTYRQVQVHYALESRLTLPGDD
ncbi:hypothetical protein FH608_010390 [Nonomuraea phyllanthi]|uniref:Uncharacterized protein n=1 Tax=Nonomuraea phyllanthi TaxID=2219224 RepID=A0A5C4WSA8_9ACTN|nr:hypothetical protein [Nonomuraea phyllanthi]KAB8195890.1 hypothetical protein FH608_010390 [Nonomuraea phyllanthi]